MPSRGSLPQYKKQSSIDIMSNVPVNKCGISRNEVQKHLKIYEELGSGSFGKVYRAFDPVVGQVVAVKMIEMDTSGDIDEVLLELKFLSELRCDQITRYFYATLHESILFVMMEYCAAGSCMHLLKKYSIFSENTAAYIMYESLKGLEYIHSQRKIHRDLKSANILVTNQYGIKIADFGVSAQLSRTFPERNSFMGTPYWMAPEVIESEMSYDTGVDIWSMGIVMFELLTGNPPYRKLHPTEAMMNIVRENAPHLPQYQRNGKWLSKDICSLVSTCLTKNPRKRPGAKRLLSCKYLQSKSLPPLDFKQMIDTVIINQTDRHSYVKPNGIKDLKVLAPPNTKHSRVDPAIKYEFGDSQSTFWDFNCSHPPTEANEGALALLCNTTAAPIPKEKSQILSSLPPENTIIPAPVIPVRRRPTQLRLDSSNQPHNKESKPHSQSHHHQKQASSGFSAENAQLWLNQAFAGVEGRTSIPRCISKIQRLHQEMEEINRMYPGFNHAFVQEMWRAMAPTYYQ